MDLYSDIFAAKRTVSTGVITTPNVITGAEYRYGAVGTYIIALCTRATASTVLVQPGEVVAGNRLHRSTTTTTAALNSDAASGTLTGGANLVNITTLNLSGTWRVLTHFSTIDGASLAMFIRIA